MATESEPDPAHLARAIFDGARDAMLLADDQGRYLDANRAACDLFGVNREDLRGRAIADFAAPGFDTATTFGDFLESGHARGEFPLMRADGELRYVDYSATAHILPGVHLSVLRDVTERKRTDELLKRTEEQLRQSQKLDAVGRLAGGVAHDFNNLLSVILSYTSLALERIAQDNPLRADLEQVEKAGARAAELTHQLLSFSHQQVVMPRGVDLNQVVLGMEKMLRRVLSERIELSLLLSEKPVTTKADPGQLEQVMLNLAINSRDAMPKGGRLTLETAQVEIGQLDAAEIPGVRPGPYVVLSITDTGMGMDRETRQRIFEPFFTTKAPGKGTGLGLSTVFGIVQQSGGGIWVDSAPNAGAVFKIYLPRFGDAPSVLPPPAPARKSHKGTETILLVEDEDQIRVLAATLLRRLGYKVLEAQNAGEAFLMCEQYRDPIHLLLTDVVMPRLSGEQLAERLISLHPEMKVLLMSGYSGGSLFPPSTYGGKLSFMEKPFTPESLGLRVRETLDDG